MSRSLRLLVVLGLAALAGCITDPVTGHKVLGMPTSKAEEEQMGLDYRPVIVQQYSGAYPDAALQSYLGSIVLGMAHHSVRPKLGWTFTVVNSSVPNAFAVPGGQVFITRGLLWRLDDEAEFAVVMGHEIGHVEHRHTVQSMGRDTLVGGLGQVLGEAIGAPEIGGAAAGLLVLRFSRDQERESDERGVHNAYTAGYDPRQGSDVFRKFLKMKQEAGGSESALDAWTSSHPLDTERIETIKQLSIDTDPRLAGDAPVPGLRVQTGRFAELIAKLRGEQKVYDRHDAAMAKITKAQGSKESIREAVPEFDACARSLPEHAYFANTLGKAYAALGDAGQARSWMERAASLDPELFEPQHVLGILALARKDWQGAAGHAERGLALLPDNYMSHWVRGEAMWNLGRRDDARTDFEAVVKSAPADSQEAKDASQRLGLQPEPPAAKPAKPAKRK